MRKIQSLLQIKHLFEKRKLFTKAILKLIENKYNFSSNKVKYDKYKQQISSQNKSKIIEDNGNIYETSNFYMKLIIKLLKLKM